MAQEEYEREIAEAKLRSVAAKGFITKSKEDLSAYQETRSRAEMARKMGVTAGRAGSKPTAVGGGSLSGSPMSSSPYDSYVKGSLHN